jgi:hypothetical protein
VKSGISYTWRSILGGIDLLKKGIIWRVGDGTSINVWQDPRLTKRRPSTSRGRAVIILVADLINPITGSLDEELVKEIFWEQDAKVILAITVHEGRLDNLVWHYERKG